MKNQQKVTVREAYGPLKPGNIYSKVGVGKDNTQIKYRGGVILVPTYLISYDISEKESVRYFESYEEIIEKENF